MLIDISWPSKRHQSTHTKASEQLVKDLNGNNFFAAKTDHSTRTRPAVNSLFLAADPIPESAHSLATPQYPFLPKEPRILAKP